MLDNLFASAKIAVIGIGSGLTLEVLNYSQWAELLNPILALVFQVIIGTLTIIYIHRKTKKLK